VAVAALCPYGKRVSRDGRRQQHDDGRRKRGGAGHSSSGPTPNVVVRAFGAVGPTIERFQFVFHFLLVVVMGTPIETIPSNPSKMLLLSIKSKGIPNLQALQW
jgi:hypothetical protein